MTAVLEWAQDLQGLWHRMASSEWTRGVGPTAPVACCGAQIDSVHHSTIPPDELDDGTERVCAAAEPEPVLALTRWKTNAAMIAAVARLGYLDGRVLDPTYGLGNFWKVWRPDGLVTHDRKLDGVDFRHLPYPVGSFDAITLDGPYKLNGTPDVKLDGRYGVDVAATRDERHRLICDGITECARVLAARGYLLVKCQDQVEGGHVRWQTRIFTDHAEQVGLTLVDWFIYPGGRAQPKDRKRKDGTQARQAHARRNYSSLLVFQAPKVWPIPETLLEAP